MALDQAASQRSRLDFWLLAALALASVAFLVCFAERPTVLITPAGHDDALFMRLGRSLAYGEWLGGYNRLTLIKGVGFPAFLAMVNFSGLSYSLALGLFHLLCVAFLAIVIWRTFNSRLLGATSFLLLLLLPPLYFGANMRVFREVFYTSLTVALIAAAIALVGGRLLRPRAAAVATGVLGAWFWLTREEGVWLGPAVAILALAPLLTATRLGSSGEAGRARLRRLIPIGVAVGVSVGCVLLYGAINGLVYGRFVINEIKDPAFQAAMDALQEASAPYASAKLPVPRAARAEIYRVSPAFASVRTPILDGPLMKDYAAAGCATDKRLCEDIGGGWFMWWFRESAALKGYHASPDKAAAFYRQVAREVRAGCNDGRLTCSSWNMPFVPPIRPGDLDQVAEAMGGLFDMMTFATPIPSGEPYSDLSAPDSPQLYRFLNRPPYEEPLVRREFGGWFVGEGNEWFDLRPATPQAVVLRFERGDSPDIAGVFNNPALTRQRFTIAAQCDRSAPCHLDLLRPGRPAARLDLAQLKAGFQPLPSGQLYIDAVGPDAKPYLKQRLARAWTQLALALQPFYRAVALAGLAAFGVLLIVAIARRRLTLPVMVAAALLAAVAARIVILALVEVLSFPAVELTYALPAMPLLLLAAVFSLYELGRQAPQRWIARLPLRRGAPSG